MDVSQKPRPLVSHQKLVDPYVMEQEGHFGIRVSNKKPLAGPYGMDRGCSIPKPFETHAWNLLGLLHGLDVSEAIWRISVLFGV